MATRQGHISTMNFQSAKLQSEIFVNETVRDITCVSSSSLSKSRVGGRKAYRSSFVCSRPLFTRPSPSSSFLHTTAFHAVAQKKYIFIYDQDGTELQSVLVRPISSSRQNVNRRACFVRPQ